MQQDNLNEGGVGCMGEEGGGGVGRGKLSEVSKFI